MNRMIITPGVKIDLLYVLKPGAALLRIEFAGGV